MGFLANLICIQLLIFQTVYSQCLNRILQGPNGPIELLPNQMLLPPGVPYLGPVLPQGQQVFLPAPNAPCPAQPMVIPPGIPAEYTSSLSPVITNYAAPPNVLSGNVIIPNMPSVIPNVVSGNGFIPNVPSVLPNVVSGNGFIPNVPPVPVEAYAPTVLHDNSVANSLANALQLLVVSSLLSNTLPEPYSPPCFDGYAPGYRYIY